MPNANEFQPSRPTPVYGQVSNIQPRNNLNILGGIGGIVGLLDGVQRLMGNDAASLVNKANAGSAEMNQFKGAVDTLGSMAVEGREAGREALVRQFPKFKDALMAYDLKTMKPGDAAESWEMEQQSRVRNNYENIRTQSDPANKAAQPAPQQQALQMQGQMRSQEPQGPPAPEQQAPQPTEVYSGQGEFPGAPAPAPDTTPFVGPVQPKEEFTGEPPVPTQEYGAPDPALEALRMVSETSGIPPEKFYISPNTGEPKLNPEEVINHPEKGPGAFVDVPLAGPEDSVIRQVNADYIPTIQESQRQLLRDGAALRVARSYRLGEQPDLGDVMQMSLADSEVDMYRADLARGLGQGFSPEEISVADMEMVAIWANPANEPALRTDPRIIEAVNRVMTMPPMRYKAHWDGAMALAKGQTDYTQWKREQDIKAETAAAAMLNAKTNESYRKDMIPVEQTRAKASAVSAEAAYLRAGGDMTSEERRTQFLAKTEETQARIASLNAATKASDIKNLAQKMGVDPKVQDTLNKYLGVRSVKQQAVVSAMGAQMKSADNELKNLQALKKAAIAALPQGMQQMAEINIGALRPSDPGKAAEFDRQIAQGGTAEALKQIKALNEELGDPLKGTGAYGRADKAREAHQKAADALVADFEKAPEEQQVDMVRDLLVSNPVAADPYQKALIAQAAPNPQSAKAFLAIFSAQGGNLPDDLTPEELAGSITPAILQEFSATLDLGTFKYSKQDVLYAAKEWLKWENLKKRAMEGKAP